MKVQLTQKKAEKEGKKRIKAEGTNRKQIVR